MKSCGILTMYIYYSVKNRNTFPCSVISSLIRTKYKQHKAILLSNFNTVKVRTTLKENKTNYLNYIPPTPLSAISLQHRKSRVICDFLYNVSQCTHDKKQQHRKQLFFLNSKAKCNDENFNYICKYN